VGGRICWTLLKTIVKPPPNGGVYSSPPAQPTLARARDQSGVLVCLLKADSRCSVIASRKALAEKRHIVSRNADNVSGQRRRGHQGKVSRKARVGRTLKGGEMCGSWGSKQTNVADRKVQTSQKDDAHSR